MKAEFTEEGLSKRRLDVEIPAEAVTEAFDKEAARFGRSLKLPGFRKGKIPKDLVKRRFRAEILDEVLRDLLPQALQEALNEHALRPIGDPKVHDLKVELGQPLSFKASFEVMPRIEAKNYKGLKVVARGAEVKDEDIETRLQSLRERAARFDPVAQRGARDGDYVAGTLIEKAADGKGPAKKQEGALIEVGAEVYHPSLHEKLQGVSSGESVSVDVVFPDDHPDSKRAGKAFSVQIEKVEVKEKVLPELDDEFAKDLGEFENLAELRDHLRQQAEEEARQQADQDLRNQLLEKLLEANPFDAPEALVEQELDQRIEEMARSLIDQGVDPSRTRIDWRELREGQREAAARSVRATILLDRIVEQENLKESEEAIEREIERAASAIKKSPQAVRAQLMKEGGLERLKRRLRRELAVDLLRESARIKRG